MLFWDRTLAAAHRAGRADAIADIWAQRAHRARRLSELADVRPAPGLRLLLNMERSADRLKTFNDKASAAGFTAERFPAIDAAADDFDPDALVAWLDTPRKRQMAARKGGTLACFLGHKGMWERFLASDHEAVAIFEDDAEPLGDPLRYLAAHPPPEGWELIGFSERSEPLDPPEGPYLPLAAAYQSHFRHARLLDAGSAPGTDGYLLSRRGARRLLSIFTEMGLPAAVDYVIVRNALTHAVSTGVTRIDDMYNGTGQGQGQPCRASGPLIAAYATTVALNEVGRQPSLLAPLRTGKYEGGAKPGAKDQ